MHWLIALALFLTTTVAQANPRKRVPRLPKPKCEKILVSDNIVEQVGAIARDLADLKYEAESRGLRVTVEKISEIQELVAETRATFVVSADALQIKLDELTQVMKENRAKIFSEIHPVVIFPQSAEKPVYMDADVTPPLPYTSYDPRNANEF